MTTTESTKKNKPNLLSMLWDDMERWAIVRPTGVRILVIIMWVFATFRQAWLWGSWILTGVAQQRAPFFLHFGFFPDIMREYPFGILLSKGQMPIGMWGFLVIALVAITAFGYVSLPPEGLNRSLKVNNRIGPALLYGGMLVLWGIFTFIQIEFP